jgi:hypothetical protein
MLDRFQKNNFFHMEKNRKKRGCPSADPNSTDPYNRLFGTFGAADVPESPEWWHRQRRNLYAITDDAELGIFGTMTTLTHNDSSPELLAVIRRGPLATPTREEMTEYLQGVWAKDRKRPDVESFAFEHVMSYQRRVEAFKDTCLPKRQANKWQVIKESIQQRNP